MGDTDEKAHEASLELYKSQLSQVTQAIQASGESEDLKQLMNDLQELIKLTEENLLEIKKAKLLKSLEPDECIEDIVDTAVSGKEDGYDDEYAAFEEAIGGASQPFDITQNPTSTPQAGGYGLRDKPKSTTQNLEKGRRSATEDEDQSESDEDEERDAVQAKLRELIGTKCRAPFSKDWGHFHCCNAMIWSVDPPGPDDDINDHKVHVIFINPTHQSMIPCKYFMDGACRFADDCRFSHGHPVKVSELQAYVEPDHSKIVEGCRCLAQHSDDVWYQAEVLEVCSDHEVHIQFDKQNETSTVLLEHIVPLDDSESESSDDDDSENDEKPLTSDRFKVIHDDDNEEDCQVPVYLWKPAQTTERLGAWEIHTRGIGSKLMSKMGYITGQGLGPNGDGRAEPVPILLLPQGKSLDKIMQLKEMSGDADLFNAMKTMEKRQKMLERKEAEKEKRNQKREDWGVFGFLNKKLAAEKDSNRGHGNRIHNIRTESSSSSSSAAAALPSSVTSKRDIKQSSEKELTKRSDQEVNVQIFRTAEEMRAVERRLQHLRTQLSRNESKDRKMAETVRQKIAEEENFLLKLKSSSQTLEVHQNRRKNHKKLTIF